ncbi:type II toxin-antitoxin system VapC family toxin [Dyadobacter aurulentus]|uniref:type II toxin-antitoxin system VapC family toxin n=1 Tax=Dyadobacter sp. UC 10 TaxID=2605428 RepID=UPI0011F35F54|nr:type II toxin-antitoxin system VapC family toxin [Dyadobacter sp. UC 10]KAA0989492.1 type II toxin-antitoxin system VapC family toxin [Dyadobacter sp. UC 10]
MTKYLLDTHILLWHSEDNRQLSTDILTRISSPDSSLFVSQASYWELTIKKSLGKLDLSVSVQAFCQSAIENSFQTLAIQTEHFACLEALPLLHSDPFDRMIIAQAISEHMVVITQDQKFRFYEGMVDILWN